MKKIYGLSVALMMIATIAVSFGTAKANVDTDVIDDSAGYTCYATYDPGTTNFTVCRGCNGETGSNLKDDDKCR